MIPTKVWIDQQIVQMREAEKHLALCHNALVAHNCDETRLRCIQERLTMMRNLRSALEACRDMEPSPWTA